MQLLRAYHPYTLIYTWRELCEACKEREGLYRDRGAHESKGTIRY